jgi:hypothetical protein
MVYQQRISKNLYKQRIPLTILIYSIHFFQQLNGFVNKTLSVRFNFYCCQLLTGLWGVFLTRSGRVY